MTYSDQSEKPARRPMLPSVPGPGSKREDSPATREAVAMAQGKALGNVEMLSRVVAPPAQIGSIAEAISNVTAEVGTIQKRGYNDYHRYHYATAADVAHALGPLIGKYGLMIMQTELERHMIEGNRIAVTYEFSIAHKSGQRMDDKIRFTSTSLVRDSKGGWDDKAINKCHTNARKYVLCGLFHVAAGDFDDEDANQPQEKVPVPGPKGANVTEALAAGATVISEGGGGSAGSGLKKITPEAIARASEQASKEGIPHKITLGAGAGSDQWASAYLRNIKKAKSREEVEAWDKANEGPLQAIYDGFPSVYEMIAAAVARQLESFGVSEPAEPAMPSDPQEAMNWIASQLQTFKDYDTGEVFWNQYVAPNEKRFDSVDWGMLMDEWQRFEARFPQEPDAA